ncbi:MAG TPA: FlgD immunoglobulin-like domain containing protein [Candidatus Eisenbacteria bacterium]
MKRTLLALVVAGVMVWGRPSFGDPEFRMSYPGGVPHAEIMGSYPQSHYTVFRAVDAGSAFVPITVSEVLCTGECFADDYGARPGAMHWYRFDLRTPDGQFLSFGPYAVVISTELARRIAAIAMPNPGRGVTQIELFLAGPPGSTTQHAEALLYDLQGRRVSTIYRGPMSNGRKSVSWSGRADDGRELSSGTYFLHFTAADGRRLVTRLLRIR